MCVCLCECLWWCGVWCVVGDVWYAVCDCVCVPCLATQCTDFQFAQ